MANKSIDMSKIRRLIQLHEQGRSNLFISDYLEISRTTVIKYLSLLYPLYQPRLKNSFTIA